MRMERLWVIDVVGDSFMLPRIEAAGIKLSTKLADNTWMA
jgi:hypothetical protein